jgi:hypothetical protein
MDYPQSFLFLKLMERWYNLSINIKNKFCLERQENGMNKIKKILSLTTIVLGSVFSASFALAAGWNVDELSSLSGLPSTSIYDIVVNLLDWLLSILGIAGVIGFVIAGLMYLLAAGNETMTGNAKKAMVASILGVIVGLSGLVIIYAVEAALSGYSL